MDGCEFNRIWGRGGRGRKVGEISSPGEHDGWGVEEGVCNGYSKKSV